MTIEHLKHGYSKLKYAVSIKHALDFKDLITYKYFNNNFILIIFRNDNVGQTGLNNMYY